MDKDNLLKEIEKERQLLHKYYNNCSKEKTLEQSQKLDEMINKFFNKGFC